MGIIRRGTNRKQALSSLGQALALGRPRSRDIGNRTRHLLNRQDPSSRGMARLVKQTNLAGSKPPLRVDQNSKPLLRVNHNRKPLIRVDLNSKDLIKVSLNRKDLVKEDYNKPPSSKDLLKLDHNKIPLW